MIPLNGIVHGLDETTYHAHDSLSSTGVRMLLPEYKGSPKKFQWAKTHPRTSRTFDVGHAVHAKVLGVGAGVVHYPVEHLTPSGNVSTKAATVDWEREQRDAGYTPVSPVDAAQIDAMAEAVLTHETARPFLEVAVGREVSVFADIDGVPCRARFDALSDATRNGVYAVDLKTAVDATKQGFESSVKRWGYDVQVAHYEETFEAATGGRVDRFLLIVVEKHGPFEVSVFELPSMWTAMGRTKTAEARRVFRECAESGVWPGYNTTVQFLDPPAWAVIDHEMRYESAEIQL